ncbi:protein quiver-like [Dreissena polymorpha]|uniref:UPAR/Ly6 domain-containing protein qvr n=1 Tax=Dreissena polymorpha TaxID=45954 RepID=A0A9D3YR44_DREPO|nr:protein quiver-like [Dreissena polymorpha]KAH3705222.1 hypothetical protein DPMN_080289 [Dreissena polymorpha]
MEVRVVVIATIAFLMGVSMEEAKGQDEDYSDPIKCFYCFGLAENSSCADPVDPKVDKDKSLQVIECESGICLKWTHYYERQLYMHRTCSHRLPDFKIIMINGVCRSERTGNGNLCMCSKNLCNAAGTNYSNRCVLLILLLPVLRQIFQAKID